eukprot:4611883-Pleurochrysis_carterae.AAC.1
MGDVAMSNLASFPPALRPGALGGAKPAAFPAPHSPGGFDGGGNGAYNRDGGAGDLKDISGFGGGGS